MLDCLNSIFLIKLQVGVPVLVYIYIYIYIFFFFFNYLYSKTQVMLKLGRRSRGNFVSLIEIHVHCNFPNLVRTL